MFRFWDFTIILRRTEVFTLGCKKREMWFDEVAIIIFEMCKSMKTVYAYKHFQNPNNEWQHITTSSRQCEVVKNYLDDFDFVFGPMVANPQDVASKISISTSHKIPKLQLASRSTEGDAFLKKRIIGVIWIAKFK